MSPPSLDRALFVIVSVVEPTSRPLPYSVVRSLYTGDERLEQTRATIESIRRHARGARIMLLELGRRDVHRELGAAVDVYSYAGGNRLIRFAVDSRHRGLGEAVGLLAFLARRRPFGQSSFVFKLSGRYRLSDDFDPGLWSSERFNFLERQGGLATRLYGVPAGYRSRWARLLLGALPGLVGHHSIESRFARSLLGRPTLNLLDVAGVEGEVSWTGDLIVE